MPESDEVLEGLLGGEVYLIYYKEDRGCSPLTDRSTDRPLCRQTAPLTEYRPNYLPYVFGRRTGGRTGCKTDETNYSKNINSTTSNIAVANLV